MTHTEEIIARRGWNELYMFICFVVVVFLIVAATALWVSASRDARYNRELADNCTDRIAALELQVREQEKIILTRPFVYREKIVYRELP